MERNHYQAGRKLLLVLISLAIISLACSLPFTPSQSPDAPAESENAASSSAPEDESGLEEGELRCQAEGYPCTLDEVPADLLAESRQIMESSLQKLKDGSSLEELAAELSENGQIVEVLYDTQSLSFQLEGAPPMWIVDPNLLGGSRSAPGKALPVLPLQQEQEPDGPAGPQPAREEPKKQALLLSPYLWEFQVDETQSISTRLQEHRNYDCADCVQLIQQPEEPARQSVYPTASIPEVLEPFLGWEEYEIIHIATHGGQVCPQTAAGSSGTLEGIQDPAESGSSAGSGCRTAIFTGSRWSGALFDAWTAAEGESETGFSIPGVVLVGTDLVPGEGVVGEIALSTDFFRSQYPDKLDDKVIFFSACKSMADTSFYHALVGENSVYLGWDDNVGNLSAKEISEKFYEILIGEGWDIQQAYRETKGFGGYQYGLEEAGADLVGAGDPALFGREMITLIHPATREELEEGDSTVTQGVIQDGEKDHLYFAALLEGIDEEHALEEYEVHVRVDGVERDHTFTPQASLQKDKNDFYVQGNFQLPFDVTNQETIQLETWVELPEGGKSRHVLNEVKPLACGWTGSMSEPISGEYSGLIMDLSQTLEAVNSGQLSQLPGGGGMSGMGSTPDMEGAGAALGEGWVLTFDPEQGLVGSLLPDLGVGNIGTLDQELLGYNTEALNYQASQPSKQTTTGTFSGSYYGLKLVDNRMQRTEGPQFQGEFTYHEGALCNLDVILPIIDNYSESNPFMPGAP